MFGFGETERRVVKYFQEERVFYYNGVLFEAIVVGKPVCSKGEPKTDVYVLARNENNEEIEIKISIKQEDADFLENKTSAERAEGLFGREWIDVIRDATLSIENQFRNRKLIFKNQWRKTQRGSITLGWKYELLNKPGGDLSGRVELSNDQLYDVYSGYNLPESKKNSKVNGRIITNSGVANYVLMNDNLSSLQDIVDNLVSIEDYCNLYPDIYFACKALNYRTFKQKYDGNRPLAVYIDWSVCKGQLTHELVFDSPLMVGGNQVANQLIESLNKIDVVNTDYLTGQNVNDYGIVHE